MAKLVCASVRHQLAEAAAAGIQASGLKNHGKHVQAADQGRGNEKDCTHHFRAGLSFVSFLLHLLLVLPVQKECEKNKYGHNDDETDERRKGGCVTDPQYVLQLSSQLESDELLLVLLSSFVRGVMQNLIVVMRVF